VLVDAEQILKFAEGLGAGRFRKRDGAMASRADEDETAAMVDRPALSVDLQDGIWACGGRAAKVEREDLVEDLGLVGFAGVLGFAAGYAEGDGPGTPVPMGDAAVEQVTHDAKEGLFGEVAVLVVIGFAEVGCKVSGMEGGDVETIGGFAGDKGERDAFGVEDDGGAVRAAEESLDLLGSGSAWVTPHVCATRRGVGEGEGGAELAVFSPFGDFLFLVRTTRREAVKLSCLPDSLNEPLWRSGRIQFILLIILRH